MSPGCPGIVQGRGGVWRGYFSSLSFFNMDRGVSRVEKGDWKFGLATEGMDDRSISCLLPPDSNGFHCRVKSGFRSL